MSGSPRDRRRLRASDKDRDETLEQLRHHGALGRLSLEELTERIGLALQAKTLGELDHLLRDLPHEAPSSSLEAHRPRALSAWRSRRVLTRAGEWLVFSLVATGLWAVTGAGGFWPAWVFVIGIILVARTASKEAARAERARRRAERTRTPPPFLGR